MRERKKDYMKYLESEIATVPIGKTVGGAQNYEAEHILNHICFN